MTRKRQFEFTTCEGDTLHKIVLRCGRGKTGLAEFLRANPTKTKALLIVLKKGIKTPLKPGVKFFFPSSWGMPEDYEVSTESGAEGSVLMQPSHTYRARILVTGGGSWGLTESTIRAAMEKLGFRDVKAYPSDELPADWPADQKERVKGMFKDTIFVQGTWTKEQQEFSTSSNPAITVLWIADITPADTKPTTNTTNTAPLPTGPLGPIGPGVLQNVPEFNPNLPPSTTKEDPNVIVMPELEIHASPPTQTTTPPTVTPAIPATPIAPSPTFTNPQTYQPAPQTQDSALAYLGVFGLAVAVGMLAIFSRRSARV